LIGGRERLKRGVQGITNSLEPVIYQPTNGQRLFRTIKFWCEAHSFNIKKEGGGYLPAITPNGSGKSGLLKVSFLWLAQL
jgi:hypothetical protein